VARFFANFYLPILPRFVDEEEILISP
jgi:hypothetical protein